MSQSRVRSGTVTAPKTTAPTELPSGLTLRTWLALIWVVAFCIWFFSFGLPNNQPLFDSYIYGDVALHPHAQRWMAWSLLPFQLLDLIDPPTEKGALPWSWLYLGERAPFLLIAGFVWLSALCVGRLILKAVRLLPSLDSMERLFYSGCLGLGGISLVMLGLGLMGLMRPVGLILMMPIVVESWVFRQSRKQQSAGRKMPAMCEDESPRKMMPLYQWGILALCGVFVGCMMLGAMSPQTDFDVNEYHLEGPKEWFQSHRISRLPHNVYTSFPFLTEMLLLTGMVVYGDWDWGALAGQAIIAGFAPLIAIGLMATGRRWFSATAGWMAALIWLTTPWTYRISIIAYAEGGLACYLFAALAMTLHFLWGTESTTEPLETSPTTTNDGVNSTGLPVAAGLLSGCAMSCKYTGLVSVVIPIGLLIAYAAGRRSATASGRLRSLTQAGCLFGFGVLISVGPWLVKNAFETGNPVFPLAYSVFGGAGRDAAMDAQWQRAHSKHYPTVTALLADLPVKMTDVVANNDWHSALMFGLAPVALLASWRKKVWVIWGFILWQFAVWFLMTHQIDRFYVPMFPAVALLAGCGAGWLLKSSRPAAVMVSLIVAANVTFNAWLMSQQGMSGFNAGRLDLGVANDLAVSRSLRWLNTEYKAGGLPPNTRILCVGEAALFHARFPYIYNTVFDRSLFEQWFGQRTASGQIRLRPADEIRATLKERKITHVLVNWAEILRYREPGSYGYTDLADPGRFDELRAAGVLQAPLPIPDNASFIPVDDSKRQQIRDWAPQLGITVADLPGYRAVQVFPVVP